jgi:ankyrin repeat protein
MNIINGIPYYILNKIYDIKYYFSEKYKQNQLLSEIHYTNNIIDINDINYTDKNGNTLLHHAVKYWNNIKIIKFLLKRGLSCNTKNNNNDTPFEFAHDKIIIKI